MTHPLKMVSAKSVSFPNDDDDEEYRAEGDSANNVTNDTTVDAIISSVRHNYKPPSHSNDFLKHLESVKSSWPYDDDGRNNDKKEGQDSDNNDNYDGKRNETYKDDGGVFCNGEPSIDPSRMLDSVIIDGESNWI